MTSKYPAGRALARLFYLNKATGLLRYTRNDGNGVIARRSRGDPVSCIAMCKAIGLLRYTRNDELRTLDCFVTLAMTVVASSRGAAVAIQRL